MTARRRVVITVIGAVTPIGTGRDALWDGLQAGRSAVRTLTRFDPSPFRSHNAAQVDDFTPSDHLDAKRSKRLDRFGQFVDRLALRILQFPGQADDAWCSDGHRFIIAHHP